MATILAELGLNRIRRPTIRYLKNDPVIGTVDKNPARRELPRDSPIAFHTDQSAPRWIEIPERCSFSTPPPIHAEISSACPKTRFGASTGCGGHTKAGFRKALNSPTLIDVFESPQKGIFHHPNTAVRMLIAPVLLYPDLHPTG